MDVRKGARLFVYTLAKILPSLFKSDMGLYEVYDFTASLEKESLLLHLGQIEEIRQSMRFTQGINRFFN